MSSDTISGFCRRHKFSRGFYYKMKERGTAPREMRDGTVVRISEQAEADWIAEREKRQVEVSEGGGRR